jgi:hypothetical protein
LALIAEVEASLDSKSNVGKPEMLVRKRGRRKKKAGE